VKFWNFIKGKAAKLLSKVGIGKKEKNKDKDKEVDGYLDWSSGIDEFKSKDGGNHEMYYKKRE
jgi:hypothetical protein